MGIKPVRFRQRKVHDQVSFRVSQEQYYEQVSWSHYSAHQGNKEATVGQSLTKNPSCLVARPLPPGYPYTCWCRTAFVLSYHLCLFVWLIAFVSLLLCLFAWLFVVAFCLSDHLCITTSTYCMIIYLPKHLLVVTPLSVSLSFSLPDRSSSLPHYTCTHWLPLSLSKYLERAAKGFPSWSRQLFTWLTYK